MKHSSMSVVTIRIFEKPDGTIETHTDFAPKPGAALTAAQSVALEMINRTRREYGFPVQVPSMSKAIFMVRSGQAAGVSYR